MAVEQLPINPGDWSPLNDFLAVGHNPDGTHSAYVFVPAPTGVAATDWAKISAAVTRAQAIVAAGGIARVVFQGCPYSGGTLTPYELGGNYIPIHDGIEYVGQIPLAVATDPSTPNWLPDGSWSFQGGTVIHGDGTAPGFWDGVTDQAAPPALPGNDTITGTRIYGFGIDNVTYGIKSGAQNVQGLVYGEVDQIWVSNASQWGIHFQNYQHVTFGKIFTDAPASQVGGQYYANNWTVYTINDGNSTFRDLFHHSSGNNRLNRGIVFDALGVSANSILGSTHVHNLQVNHYSRTLQSDTATFTSGSTSVSVADGTKYAVNLPVWVTATNFGFTSGRIYFVLSVVGNTITLGNSRSAAAISASGSGTLTLDTYGMACLEVGGSQTGTSTSGTYFDWIDVEGGSTAAIVAENAALGKFEIVALPSSMQAGVVLRAATRCDVRSTPNTWVDADGSCTGTRFFGSLLGFLQRSLPGSWYQATTNTGEIQVRSGDSVLTADLQGRSQGFLYPAASGIGEHVAAVGGTGGLTGTQCGVVVITTGGITLTLPTITALGTNPTGTIIGAYYDLINITTTDVTLNTDGTQLFNFVTGLTSITIPAGGRIKVHATARTATTFLWSILSSHPAMVSADNGDAAKTLTVRASAPTQRWATPLTVNRAVTLSTVGAYNGAKFHVVRTAAATGAPTLDVGTGPLKSLAAGQWCDVEYDGAAWLETAFGSL